MTEDDEGAASVGFLREVFGLDGQVAVVTGATGVLGGAMARALSEAGTAIGVLARGAERAEALAASLPDALALPADVRDRAQLEAARAAVHDRYGRLDLLVCAAGGNVPEATLAPGAALTDLPEAAFREVVDLNLLGTWLPCQILAPTSAIVTVSSMAAGRALSRVGGYGAAKAAVESLTRWLAATLPGVRVNAIAPGFFLGEQNRALLVDAAGAPTERGSAILAHTPAGRFGAPEDLAATVVWLCSPGARFVTGAVVPVDGGFSAFSGV